MSTPTPKVYAAINAVQTAMSKEGISKDRKNQQQGYSFRGIDDCYAALAPHLSANKLCILPRVIDRTVLERETKSGGNLFYTALKVEFDFVAVEDGSKHTVCTVGEAMDSGDKSSNKAMSAAYKYACFQAFAIPTEGDNDADAQTHDVKPKAARKPLSPEVDKKLRFLAGTPKGAGLIDRVLAKHELVGIDDMDDALGAKTAAWVETELSKETKK